MGPMGTGTLAGSFKPLSSDEFCLFYYKYIQQQQQQRLETITQYRTVYSKALCSCCCWELYLVTSVFICQFFYCPPPLPHSFFFFLALDRYIFAFSYATVYTPTVGGWWRMDGGLGGVCKVLTRHSILKGPSLSLSFSLQHCSYTHILFFFFFFLFLLLLLSIQSRV